MPDHRNDEKCRLEKLTLELEQLSWKYWVFHVDGSTGQRTLLGVSNYREAMEDLAAEPGNWPAYVGYLRSSQGDWLEIADSEGSFEIYGPNTGYPSSS